jgi:hypothetical protein
MSGGDFVASVAVAFFLIGIMAGVTAVIAMSVIRTDRRRRRRRSSGPRGDGGWPHGDGTWRDWQISHDTGRDWQISHETGPDWQAQPRPSDADDGYPRWPDGFRG